MKKRIVIPDNKHVEMLRAAVQQDFPGGPPTFAEGDRLIGRNVRNWFASVTGKNGGRVASPEVGKMNRALLEKLVREETETLPLCIMILAWGDMQVSNGRHLFRQPVDGWLAIAEKLRRGKLTRSQGYAEFAALRKSGGLAGMGPAYFTKLLHFLLPHGQKGYIMDQWLGCSVNLLLQRDLVLLDETRKWKQRKGNIDLDITSWVSDANSAGTYEDFCLFIEALAGHLGEGWTPENAEFALMSEGRGVGAWRRYVVAKRREGNLNFTAGS